MKKIIDYMTIYNFDLDDFNEDVSSYLMDGWQPFGGLAINTHDKTEYFYQTLVKYEKDN